MNYKCMLLEAACDSKDIARQKLRILVKVFFPVIVIADIFETRCKQQTTTVCLIVISASVNML